jgi:predicted ATPase
VLCSHVVADLMSNELAEVGAELVDLGEHRLKDLGHPEHIYQVTAPELRLEFPPLKTLSAAKTNLPIEVTSFVGRHQEMAGIDKLLRASRLVTLTGAAGCGKSRLAVEVAAELIDEFADGVWLVELASISDPELASQAVASVFDLQEQSDRTFTEVLVTALRSQRLLLLLDNCEHMLESVSRLVTAVLSGTPNVKVLTTSQAPLLAHGEALYPVSPLPLPEDDADPVTIARSDAVRLFVERAALAKPDFRLSDDNASTVGAICRHLDGIPLAVELAAALTRLLALSQIAQRLDDRFRLLRHGSRGDLPHHKTLEAAISWSYDHLTRNQQTLFTRLSVFEGGWTLDAAERICAGGPFEAFDILPLLTELVDRSLIVVSEEGSDFRYGFLESIQAFAATKRDPLIDHSHAEYFVALAEELAPLMKSDQERAASRFGAELGNFRVALDRLDQWGRPVEYSRLIIGLAGFLRWRRLYSEADRRLQRALETVPEDVHPRMLGHLYLHAGRSAGGWRVMGPGPRNDRAAELFKRSLPLLFEAGDDVAMTEALVALVMIGRSEYAAQAIEIATRSGDRSANARVHYAVGINSFFEGAYQAALDRFERALEGEQAVFQRLNAMSWKATVLAQVGDLERALALSDEILRLAMDYGDLSAAEGALGLRAGILMDMGQPEAAIEDLMRQIKLQRDILGHEERNVHAEAAFAHAEAHDVSGAIHHLGLLRQMGVAPGDDLLFHDQLDRVFIAVALIADDHDDPTMAAMSLGAQTTYRTTVNIPPSKPRSEVISQITRRIRALLSAGGFDAAWKRGSDLTLDQVLDLVLSTYGTQ